MGPQIETFVVVTPVVKNPYFYLMNFMFLFLNPSFYLFHFSMNFEKNQIYSYRMAHGGHHEGTQGDIRRERCVSMESVVKIWRALSKYKKHTMSVRGNSV